jgi:hypothetical protein
VSTIPVSLIAATTIAEKLADADRATIVVVALCIVGGMFALWRSYYRGRATSGRANATPIAVTTSRTAAESQIAQHLLPVLVAAATAAVGRRVVIHRITFINRNTVSGWAEAGRASIQLSHNLRRTM